MSNETGEVSKTQELQVVSEVVEKKFTTAAREFLEFLRTQSLGSEALQYLRFSENDIRTRTDALRALIPLMEAFAQSPEKFNICDFHLKIEYPSLRGRWGCDKEIWVLRRLEDPEPSNDPDNPTLQFGFMILEEKVSIEEIKQIEDDLKFRKSPREILEVKDEKIPGKKLILFAAGVYRERAVEKTDYYAGVQYECSSVFEQCFKPDGVVLTGGEPYKTPFALTEVRITKEEAEILGKFFRGIKVPG